MGTAAFIDNSALIPKLVCDAEVTLVSPGAGAPAVTPEWVSGLIMTEIHIETATRHGTLAAAVEVLDHCAELGVNGVWLTPVYAKGKGNGYGNLGPHTVEPELSGTSDYARGWEAVKSFVCAAHKRNIRVILDIVTWGTNSASPLTKRHPDWFSGSAWGGAAFNWKNPVFVDWFVQTATDNIVNTGADGYRCDCEPEYAGYAVFGRIRKACLAAGRKIFIIAEDGCRRGESYDAEQDGVLLYSGWSRAEQYGKPKQFYLDELDIVDSVRNGTGIGMAAYQQSNVAGQDRFYIYCVSNHDYRYSSVNKNRLVLAYQAIFAPYIPLWYYGGEFGMEAKNTVIYFEKVDRGLLDIYENRAFFEDVKRYIAIRRTYPEIFSCFPENHRDANLCRVKTDKKLGVTAYARYAGGKAVLIVPNYTDTADSVCVTLPSEEAGLDDGAAVTDLISGEKMAVNDGRFSATVDAMGICVFLAG